LRTNYVLVQPEQLGPLAQDHFKVLLFVGANQARLSYEMATAIHQLGSKAEYIKISGNGPNALDLHIAFYIGQIAAADPSAYFHIISKDKGFDPLIQHLKTRKIFAARARDVSEIPLVKVANSKSPEQRLEIVVARLKQLKPSKPRRIKTLRSTVASLFQKQPSESEVTALLDVLQARGLVTVTDGKVAYALPTANNCIDRSAQQLRRWVPVALRAPAPGHAGR
jgi:hypothetical protein